MGTAGAQSIEAANCLSQGCCYEPAPGDIGGTYLELPACFVANDGVSNYAVRGSTLQTGGELSVPLVRRHLACLRRVQASLS